MSSSLQDIQAQDFILTPGRYVGIAEQEDDGEPFAEVLDLLSKNNYSPRKLAETL
ncbi:MAG: hypothetical protein IKR31_06705 [Prevotella sp.]|nr:hypothetical protein [Prevotella sp.]